MMTTSDDLLMGGGAAFFSFAGKNEIGQFVTKPYGTKVAGTVASIGEPTQQTDYATGALQTWPDGKPKLQFAITLDVDWQNTIGDAPADNDDRQRSVMIKQSSQLQGQLRDAIKNAGAQGLQTGAYMSVTLTGEQPSSKGNPLKTYAVEYRPPAQGVVMDGAPQQLQQGGYVQQYSPQAQAAIQGVQQIQQQYPAPPPQVAPQPVAQAPAQPVQAQPQPAQAPNPMEIARKLLHELKLPPEQVAASTGLTLGQVQQIPPW